MANQMIMWDAAAEDFHARNPWLLDELAEHALQLKREGYERWSVDSLLHHIRFTSRHRIEQDKSGFRVNNNFSAFYSRRLMEQYPELDGFFRIRLRRVKEREAA